MIIQPPPAPPSFRIKRGTKFSAIQQLVKDEIPPWSHIDGAFQLAEYLALKVRADPHDVKGLVEVPLEDRSMFRDVWIYEHLRRLPIDLTPLISQLLNHCTRASCPEMKADEWQYLCVAHGSGVSEECCAVDYILHTLDQATAILSSTKNFPSRLSIPPGSISHFPSLARRLSRIFSHAYFHHREQFLLAESETSLYARFVAMCERYSLIGKELLIIPHAATSSTQEEDELEESGSEEQDEDATEAEEGDEVEEEEGEPGRQRDKGDAAKGIGGGRRTLSLDRQSGVGVKLLKREKGKEGDAAGELRADASDRAEDDEKPFSSATSTSTDTPASSETRHKGGDPDPDGPETAKKIGTLGRGTRGRGKQGRGTMLWSSDSVPDVPPVSEASNPAPSADVPMSAEAGNELSRTDSRDSVIHIGPEAGRGEEEQVSGIGLIPNPAVAVTASSAEPSEGGKAMDLAGDDEVDVPKDEIELLEEEGKLDPLPTVSPLPPPSAPSAVAEDAGVSSEGDASTEQTAPSETAASASTAAPKDTGADVAETALSSQKTNQTTPAKSISGSSSVSPSAATAATTSPNRSPSYKSTAAASPLNPPRTLSRSPEARHRALSNPPDDESSSSSPTQPSARSKAGPKPPKRVRKMNKAAKDSESESGEATNSSSALELAGLAPIPQEEAVDAKAGDDMDAEGKQAVVAPMPASEK